jgi:hypothetical protein
MRRGRPGAVCAIILSGDFNHNGFTPQGFWDGGLTHRPSSIFVPPAASILNSLGGFIQSTNHNTFHLSFLNQ